MSAKNRTAPIYIRRFNDDERDATPRQPTDEVLRRAIGDAIVNFVDANGYYPGKLGAVSFGDWARMVTRRALIGTGTVLRNSLCAVARTLDFDPVRGPLYEAGAWLSCEFREAGDAALGV